MVAVSRSSWLAFRTPSLTDLEEAFRPDPIVPASREAAQVPADPAPVITPTPATAAAARTRVLQDAGATYVARQVNLDLGPRATGQARTTRALVERTPEDPPARRPRVRRGTIDEAPLTPPATATTGAATTGAAQATATSGAATTGAAQATATTGAAPTTATADVSQTPHTYDDAAALLTSQGLPVLTGTNERNIATLRETSDEGEVTERTVMFWKDAKGAKQFREYAGSGADLGLEPQAGDATTQAGRNALESRVAKPDQARFIYDLTSGGTPTKVNVTAAYSTRELDALKGVDLDDARTIGVRPRFDAIWKPTGWPEDGARIWSGENGGWETSDPEHLRVTSGEEGAVVEQTEGKKLQLMPDDADRLARVKSIPKDLTWDQFTARYGSEFKLLDPAVQAKVKENPRLAIAGLQGLTNPMSPLMALFHPDQPNGPQPPKDWVQVHQNSHNGSWLSVGCERGYVTTQGEHPLGYMKWDDRLGLIAPKQAYIEPQDHDSFGGFLVGAVVGIMTGGLGLGAVAAGALGGAASAAVNGGNILEGAVMGGITGGIGMAAAPIGQSIGEAVGSEVVGNMAGRAVTGAVSSAVTGGDWREGALGGAVGALANEVRPSVVETFGGGVLADTLSQAATGALVSAASGGNVVEGLGRGLGTAVGARLGAPSATLEPPSGGAPLDLGTAPRTLDFRGQCVPSNNDATVSYADLASASVGPLTVSSAAQQSSDGNCYILASINAIGAANGGGGFDYLTSLADVSADASRTRLYTRSGQPFSVVTDNAMPLDAAGHPTFADLSTTDGENNARGLLLTKAVTQALPYASTSGASTAAGSFSAAGEGGDPATVLAMLTGNRPAQVAFSQADTADNGPDIHDYLVDRMNGGSGVVLVTYPQAGAGVTDPTAKDPSFYAGTGLVPGHAYAMLDVGVDEDGTRYVTLQNPWKAGEPGTLPGSEHLAFDGTDDGIFRMKWDDALRLFDRSIAVAVPQRSGG